MKDFIYYFFLGREKVAFSQLSKNGGRKYRAICLFWLLLSIAFSLLYGAIALKQAFGSEYIVQDDARQHVFWMYRFLDPKLFPNDLIANYFQSVAPLGYKIVYAVPALFVIEPFLVNKLLPTCLGLITTCFSFAIFLELLPIPWGGFIAATILNQNLWLQDGLISATPKAFAIPLFLAFLYYYLKRSLWGVAISIALLGLFYPSLVFIAAGVLIWQLLPFSRGKQKGNYILSCVGLLVALVILLPYAISSSEYAPVITVAQARKLPEFVAGARAGFFDDNLWDFWFNGSRSGIKLSAALMPPLTYLAILLPVILKFPRIFPGVTRLNSKLKVLPELIIVSLLLFAIAHAVLFKLHLPSRYTQHTLKIAIVLAASIVTTLIFESLFGIFIKESNKLKSLMAIATAFCLAAVLIFYPYFAKSFVWTQYITGDATELYQFLQRQPKDTLIASLTSETDNLPSFTKRSILASREYAIPYHTGYYFPFRQRAIDTIAAQYSPDIEVVKNFIRKYDVDLWLLETSGFTVEYLQGDRWIAQHQSITREVTRSLQQGNTPALAAFIDRCSIFSDSRYDILATECILSQK
ncbi:hypothetical protein [Myxosarcina sp. GI1]|uniref:hypothetical protein n=1 Tax=Myxosarcina sp. GI1 TaxID=1541065 RepID=UPI00068F0976|nr:hypothetical protein [Myxosarcina sp. GI1]